VYEGQEFVLKHGAVLIAAITSCTNTSNPRFAIKETVAWNPFKKTCFYILISKEADLSKA
jgi:hypothetical protein